MGGFRILYWSCNASHVHVLRLWKVLISSLSIIMLCAPVFIFTSSSPALLGHPTLWFIDLTVTTCHIQYTFWVYPNILMRSKTHKIKPEKYSMLTLLRLKVNKQTFPLCSERCSIVTLPKLPYEGASPVSMQENCFANGRPVNSSFCVNSLSPTDVSALNNPDSSLQNKDVAHE